MGAGDDRGDRPAGDGRLDLRTGAVRDDDAVRQHHDPIGEVVGLFQVVGREQHGPAARGELAHRRPERPPDLDIHRDRWLVQHQQVGIGHQRQRVADALGLAAGQLGGLLLGDVGDAGEFHRLGDRHRPAVQRGEQPTNSPTVTSGSRAPPCSMAPTRPACTASTGRARRRWRCRSRDGSAPAACRWWWTSRRRWPQEGHHLAGCDLQVDPADGLDVSETLVQPGQPDRCAVAGGGSRIRGMAVSCHA